MEIWVSLYKKKISHEYKNDDCKYYCAIVLYMNTTECIICDNCFRFAIDGNRVPVFVSQTTAQRILTCGKAVVMIKLFQFLESTRLHPSAIYMKSSSLILPDTIESPSAADFPRSSVSRQRSGASAPVSTLIKERPRRGQGAEFHGVINDEISSEYDAKSDVSEDTHGDFS